MARSYSLATVCDRLTPAAGGLIGGLFFLWISGLSVITPTQFGWVMQLDWRIHFLGWHFFRREPWHWPPGLIEGYLAPAGTAIGFTDSIPLVAFLLKPFSSLLPPTFQYLGLWLLVCFILQGAFGVLLIRLWTSDRLLQLLGGALFVLMPTLLIRVGHPSLCAHWLLLWALWLYLRGERGTTQAPGMQAALGLVAGLIHPYLAVMVLALLGALALKDLLGDREGPRLRAVAGFVGALAAIVTGWWASGLFTVSGADNLATEGLGYYSMNLLSPITPSGWSTLLPDVSVGAGGQPYEGFQYVGAGALLLIMVAVAGGARRAHSLPWRSLWPVALTAGVCALYALSPRVTLGSDVLVDVTSSVPDALGTFRATGRFFWPMAYLILTCAIAIVMTRLRPRLAVVVVISAVILQLVDLGRAHQERRVTSRSDAFHAHRLPLQSPVWSAALPHYRHLVMLPPPQCGGAATSFEWPAYLAGLHGLTVNAGEVARPDNAKLRAYCATLERDIAIGSVAPDTMYLVNRSLVKRLQAASQIPLVCGEADGIPICVAGRSLDAWHQQVEWP